VIFQEVSVVNTVYCTAKVSLCDGNTLLIVSCTELELQLTLFQLIFLWAGWCWWCHSVDCLFGSGLCKWAHVSYAVRIQWKKGFPFRCSLAVSMHCHMCTAVRLCGTLCAQIFCIFRSFVKILWLSDAVLISLVWQVSTVISYPVVSSCVRRGPQLLIWAAGGAPVCVCHLPSRLENTCTHLATKHYRRIGSQKVFCNPLWHFSAFDVCATWILMKQHCVSYWTHFWERLWYTWDWHQQRTLTVGHGFMQTVWPV
jgi:hypothetical protein